MSESLDKPMKDPFNLDRPDQPAAFASSPTIAELITALVAAQKELGPAIKNATNPHFHSDYADLTSHLETALPILSKHDLALIQLPGFEGDKVVVTTVLAHKSGEWISTKPGLKQEKGGPHELGSLVTYLRRYGLGIYGASQADDDANEGEGKPVGQKVKQDDPAKVIPMGKHKGTAYEELPLDYLEWAAEKMADGTPKTRCVEELNRRANSGA